MDRLPIQSSNLEAVGYDADNLVLEVEFKSGSVYQYEGVPISVYDALMVAPSAGRYFYDAIRDKYPTTQV